MGKGGHQAARKVLQAVAPPHPVIIGQDAEAELIELLDYVRAQSPRNANLVAARIDKEVIRIARNPEADAADLELPELPGGAVARKSTVSGYTVRYLYPFVVQAKRHVLVVSIRRGNRKALEDQAYLLRWLEERARPAPGPPSVRRR